MNSVHRQELRRQTGWQSSPVEQPPPAQASPEKRWGKVTVDVINQTVRENQQSEETSELVAEAMKTTFDHNLLSLFWLSS